jgi:outer membrane lipoprotein SlyB
MFRGTSLWTGLIAGGLYQLEDTKAYKNGEINKKDYAARTTTNVSSAVGIMAGVEYGAALGTAVLPGFGTIVGSVLGAVVGDRLGQFVGGQAGQWINKPSVDQQQFQQDPTSVQSTMYIQ